MELNSRIGDMNPEIHLREILNIVEHLQQEPDMPENLLTAWKKHRQMSAKKISKLKRKLESATKKKKYLKATKITLLALGITATVVGKVLIPSDSPIGADCANAGTLMRKSSKVFDTIANSISTAPSTERWEDITSQLEHDIKLTHLLRTWLNQTHNLDLHIKALFGRSLPSLNSNQFNNVISVFKEVAIVARLDRIGYHDMKYMLDVKTGLLDASCVLMCLQNFMEYSATYGRLPDLIMKLSQCLSPSAFTSLKLGARLWSKVNGSDLDSCVAMKSFMLDGLGLKSEITKLPEFDIPGIPAAVLYPDFSERQFKIFQKRYSKSLDELDDVLADELINVERLFPDNDTQVGNTQV